MGKTDFFHIIAIWKNQARRFNEFIPDIPYPFRKYNTWMGHKIRVALCNGKICRLFEYQVAKFIRFLNRKTFHKMIRLTKSEFPCVFTIYTLS